MGEIFTEGGRSFLILEAIRGAARDFYRNAPKTEEEQRRQALRLNRDQETIWYDPDFIQPLQQLAFSRKWGERFRELERGGKPSDVLKELRAEIDENGLRGTVLNALNCWAGELAKKRNESGLPEYRLEHVKEQIERMELARKGLCELDAEGRSYRDYIGHLQAVQWLNGVTGEAAPAEQAAEQAAGDGAAGQNERPLSAEERCKAYIKIRYELAMKINSADLRHYRPGKPGRPKKMAEDDTLEAYIKLIHGGFNKENDKSKVAYSTFKAAFKAYKASL